MKQKDIALIVVVIFISAIVALFASKAIFSAKSKQQQAEVVQPITAEFPQPDSHYFNSNTFDPSQTITIGQSSNSNSFNGSTSQ